MGKIIMKLFQNLDADTLLRLGFDVEKAEAELKAEQIALVTPQEDEVRRYESHHHGDHIEVITIRKKDGKATRWQYFDLSGKEYEVW